MAIEAEWQANRELVLALEDDRANESHRAPVDLFLRQARFALTLRRMFAQRKICHVHATSSRALICGVLLKKMLGVSLSASIEAKPAMSREAIENALQPCRRRADRRPQVERTDRALLSFLTAPRRTSLWCAACAG